MHNLQVVEVKGIRVLTTKQIAEAYETEGQIITNNFNRQSKRYEEGKHFICLKGSEKAEFIKKNQNDFSSYARAKAIYLWTEKGALLHAKSLNTDKAWEVYEYLVDYYFRVKEEPRQQVSEKPKGKLLVDIPVNDKAQDLIRELKKNISGMEATLDIYNRYGTEKKHESAAYMIGTFGMEIAKVACELGTLKPKLIEKIL